MRKSFEFLQVPTAARAAGPGTINVSLADRDIHLRQFNPALAGDTLAGAAAVRYQFYVAGISHTSIAYAHHFKWTGVLTFGVQHLDYGTITSYDAIGAELCEFKMGETALAVYFAQLGFPKPSSFDQVFRHFNFAGEIRVHRNVDLLVGYNHS